MSKRTCTDATEWAVEFVRLHGGDKELMLSWFANAIEAARGAGIDSERERIRLEMLEEAEMGSEPLPGGGTSWEPGAFALRQFARRLDLASVDSPGSSRSPR